jgi:TP901 family phage tail tape measure protein
VANRTVSVALKAEIGQYVAGMSKASAATMRVGEAARDSQAQASKHFDLAGKAGLVMGGLVVAGLGMAVAKTMEFEKSMSAISAATGATGASLEQFRSAAMKAGADSQYSATEAANAITEMAKAGVSAKDILGGGLAGALDLAAAGQLDVADAAGIASVAMTQFSLSGKDLPHVADLLAAGAGKAMGSVDDLGMALKQSGLIASAAGLSIEETTGGLSAFASAGLIGSDAGTSFKTMLQALQAPSTKAAGVMSDLGLNMYDANGNMLGLSDMAGQLQDKLGGLTEEQRNSALATIFGSDAVRAANVLYKEGAVGIAEWTAKVNDAGYAHKQAAALTDNLAGDIERLGGALDTAFIKSGGAFTGILRDLAQGLTGIINGASALMDVIGAIPGPVLATVAAMGAFLALRGPLSTLFNGIADAATRMAFSMASSVGAAGGFKGAMSGLASSINPTMVALGAATLLFTSITSRMAETAAQEDKLAEAMLAGGAAALKVNDDLRNQQPTEPFEWMRSLDEWTGAAASMDDVRKKARDLYDAMSPLQQAQSDVTKSTNDLALAIDKYGKDSPQAKDAADQLAQASQDLAAKQGEVKTATDEAAKSLAATPAVMDNAYGSLSNYAAALGLDKDATKNLIDASDKLGESLANFIDPLGTYTGLLQQKAQAEADAANKTAEKTGASAKSWEDFKDSVHVTFDEYMADLEKQVEAQNNWQTNMLLLAGRVSAGTLAELSRMGPEGAPLVADLVNRSDAELDKFDDITAQRSKEATDAWGAQLTLAAPVLAAVGKTAGQGVVAALVAQLQAGTITVAQIAQQYGINLAGGINPILDSLGRARVPVGSAAAKSGGYAAGGYTGDGPKYTPAGIVHKGEFVFPKEAVSRIGVSTLGSMAGLPGYATGGYVSGADVPKPRSTAPYGPPISTAGDATMGKEYDEVKAWVEANSMGPGPTGPPGAGVERWRALVLAALNLVHQPGSYADITLRRMNQESGGNPRAINLTDSNAKRGTPSKGLMQVIDPTFRAYAMAGHNSDIWDPMSNVLASMRYAMARYGSLPAAYNKAGGYDQGGLATDAGYLAKGTVAPERVLSPRQTAAFEGWMSRETSGASGGSYGGPVTVNIEGATLSGTFDLGDGLEGRMTAVVVKALTTTANRRRYNS